MTREEILLKQYEILSERKLHFGKLFWQTPTIFVALCVFIAGVLKDLTTPIIWWFILITGGLLMILAYIGYRHKQNEDQYELLMREIEEELYKNQGAQIFHAPLSKLYGARFITSVLLFSIGVTLFFFGTINLFR